MNQQNQVETMLWHCQFCRAWWGSGRNTRDAAVLLRYATSVTNSLAWADYRGWRNMVATATCPQCSRLGGPFLQTNFLLQDRTLRQYEFQPYLEIV